MVIHIFFDLIERGSLVPNIIKESINMVISVAKRAKKSNKKLLVIFKAGDSALQETLLALVAVQIQYTFNVVFDASCTGLLSGAL